MVFSAFTLLFWRQEGHLACKNWVVRYWHGYLCGARCKWFAYGPADATATPSSLAPLKSRMVHISGAGLPRLSWKKGHKTSVAVVVVVKWPNKGLQLSLRRLLVRQITFPVMIAILPFPGYGWCSCCWCQDSPATFFHVHASTLDIVMIIMAALCNRCGHYIFALLHGSQVVGVSQTLRRWTEGATYIRQGSHHVGHWPTFLVLFFFVCRCMVQGWWM